MLNEIMHVIMAHLIVYMLIHIHVVFSYAYFHCITGKLQEDIEKERESELDALDHEYEHKKQSELEALELKLQQLQEQGGDEAEIAKLMSEHQHAVRNIQLDLENEKSRKSM